jgi:glycerol-3-phosphate cytidylyltransferase
MGLRVYTGGTFDLFHAGHVEFLERCASFGSVIVSLNTDEFIERYKGKKPIMSYKERLSVLLACKYVTAVIPNTGGSDSRESVEFADPDIIVIGSDWARRDYYAQMGFDQDWLDERNIALCYVPYTKGISSTDIKGRMQPSGKIEAKS